MEVLQQKILLTPEQSAWSTEDQVAFIITEIKDSFQRQEQAITVLLDFEQAIDKAWNDGLMIKIAQMVIGFLI